MKRLFAFLPLLLSLNAFASLDTSQQILLAPPSQSVTQAPSAHAAGGSPFSVGLGAGFNNFGGNMGRLYSSGTVADVRANWTLNDSFVARAGGEFAGYSFNAAPVGPGNVSTQALTAGLEGHYLGTARKDAGFDPYVAAGVGNLWRSQTFTGLNDVEKDSAALVSAGLGTNFRFTGSRLGLWAEADVTRIFFADRYSGEYAPSGISDMTGLLYSGRAGVKYVF